MVKRSEAGPALVSSLSDCPRLWTIQDVSAYLGVPVATLYGWRHRGDGPPAIRLGKHLRWMPDDVRAWVERQAA